ncbi:MAG: hypothetical protein ACE5G1_17735 [bacterium]
MIKFLVLIITSLVLAPSHIPQVTEPALVDTTLANGYFLKAEELAKITALTVSQFINFVNQRTHINHIKHSFA